MNITYISSYVPRKCGIATYTRDLAVEAEKQGDEISIIALENPIISHSYSPPVSQVLMQYSKKDYLDVAKKINKSTTEVVHIQHEFGLFGGTDGKDILLLASALTKPLIVTLHTVLLTPSTNQKQIISELCRLSRKIIVMDKIAKDRLQTVYGLNPSDITIILHGAPIVEKTNSAKAKKEINYPNSFIVLANNLLSRNKGIEYAIDAISKVVKQIPSIMFLVVGETHPIVKSEEGESYREELIEQVKKLGIGKNVKILNEYVTTDSLKNFLSAADVYTTPYLDPQQTTSGTLSYAIGAGKVCIATEYVYAKEMLSNGKGIIVPFRDSDAIAAALLDVYQNPQKKLLLEKKTGTVSKEMSWAKIAQKHNSLYKKTTSDDSGIKQKVQQFINSPINISYLIRLTNSVGVIQHADTVFPDLKYGYSTDDNARALIVVAQVFKKHRSDEFTRLIKVYLDFINSAQEQNGKFHTFLTAKETWSDTEGVTDAYGRVMWGLGFYLYTNRGNVPSVSIKALFEKSMKQLPNILDIRTVSYTILGLYYYILTFEQPPVRKENEEMLQSANKELIRLGKILKDAYKSHSQVNWDWFEGVITYDNFRLPQSLFAVYLKTGDLETLEIASKSLRFITECNFDSERGYFDFIGQNGWHGKDIVKADYDQQPLEAAGAVDANIFASIAHQNPDYLEKANLAFEWFFGSNRNHRTIYDENSKGVADGLTLRGVNLNQGAESIICFLISALAIQENLQENAKLANNFTAEKLLQKKNLDRFKYFSSKSRNTIAS